MTLAGKSTHVNNAPGRTASPTPGVSPQRVLPDTRAMPDDWVHLGRLWTNGDPYLAVDAAVRHLWLGFSEDEYFDRIVDLGPEETGISLGEHTAAVVGADGVVRDDSWMEVFESPEGSIAIIQASGDDYRKTLTAALRYPGDSDDPGTTIHVRSGELAVFSAACDGAGEYSMTLRPALPGRAPAEHGAPARAADTGLLVKTRSTRYRVEARSYTELDGASCFARWLLVPEQPAP
ncbi:hypothetical protein [Actinoplanes sp. NPDC049599]|uniref:hypothetical protein n=1 Tax=Actinoplanes sp. NPDC049599 TaxID=3363903 RepID=UPI0037AC9206